MKQLDLLNGKIFPTMLRLSTPLMLTAFIQMAYSLTDIAWIGRLSTDAVAAAGQVGFLIWIAESLTVIPRLGMSVLTSQTYGSKDYHQARLFLNNGFWLAIIMGLVYGSMLLIFRDPIIHFFRLEEQVNRLTEAYLLIIAVGMPLFFVNPVLSGAYQCLGNSKTPFRVNAIGLITNIVVDPLLIFGLGPVPALGIRGAAFATVMAQGVVFFLFLNLIRQQDDLIGQSHLLRWSFDRSALIKVIKIGTPASLQANIHALISVLLNRYVASFGALALAVGSVGSMIESICWMTTEGVSIAITALVGQNYGAHRYDRVQKIYRVCIQLLGTIGTISTFIIIVFRYQLFQLFVPGDREAIALGAVYLLILGVSQFFMSFEIGCSGFLNGIGETRQPAMVNTVFNLLRIPLALLLMPLYGVEGVWAAMSLSTILKGILLFFLSSFQGRRLGLRIES